MINTMRVIQKIIANYWEMDIKPFLKVVLKPSDTSNTSKTHIKQWEDDEDVEVYGKQHKHWDDSEMSEMPYVESNTSRLNTSRDRDTSERDTLREDK